MSKIESDGKTWNRVTWPEQRGEGNEVGKQGKGLVKQHG